MPVRGFALFETTIGHCGIAWGRSGLVGVQLPEGSAAQTRARMRRRFPDAHETTPPPSVRKAAMDIAAVMCGEKHDLSAITLDMNGVPPFYRRVYEAARQIPPGATVSYGELATRIHSPRGARAVGQALRRNPFAIIVPCHRVLAANGKPGGFTAAGGVSTKRRMLGIEGVHTAEAGALAFDPPR
jgi:methylated-DNA-[protein]-cysteine S-methyltransferase